MRACRQQRLEQHQAGRLAHIIGTGLEGQPPDRYGAPPYKATEVLMQRLEQHGLLHLVARLHCLQDGRLVSGLLGAMDQCTHVLGEARAAIAAAGIDEVTADTRIAADAATYLLDVHVRACKARPVR